MTKDEKIDALLRVYCDYTAIPHGEAYVVAFGDWDNLPIDQMHKKMKDQAILTEAMTDLGLITTNDSLRINYQATSFGRDIQDNGGWLKHLTLKIQKDNNEQTKNDLEFENLKLQNDNLKNEINDRIKKEEIDKLTIENLKLQNRNNKIWFFVIGGIIGTILTNIRWILELLEIIKTD